MKEKERTLVNTKTQQQLTKRKGKRVKKEGKEKRKTNSKDGDTLLKECQLEYTIGDNSG